MLSLHVDVVIGIWLRVLVLEGSQRGKEGQEGWWCLNPS